MAQNYDDDWSAASFNEGVGGDIPPALFKGGEEDIAPAPFKGGEEDIPPAAFKGGEEDIPPAPFKGGNEAAIGIENLTKRFGAKVAVNALNLAIPAGEFFCFLGPNGAGKTTTIKMLTGLLRPTGGRAVLGGHDMARDPVAAKRLLGYVPDTPFLYEKLTGREFMRFVAGLYRMEPSEYTEYSEELLQLFEIRSVADQLIEDYSHGMRQKLSFAACFLHRPEIVIVDEPWVGLDPKSIRFVKDFLKSKTRTEHLTVFMSTHTLGIAEEIADRIGIIHQGKLLHVGSVPEILALAHRPGSLEDVFLQVTQDEGTLG